MKSTSWKTYNERHKVVTEAQRLARSGQYPDRASIIPLLQHMEGFEAARARFEDRTIRAQLDRLCAMARAGRSVEAPPHAATRAQPRS